MTLTEIRGILAERGLAPNKRFGQHFLHDQNLCRWLVRQAQLGPGEPVWEIGPGLGSLTEALVANGHPVRAVEIDRGFAAYLRERFSAPGQCEVIEADAVVFCEEGGLEGGVVMGNLPYNATTPLIMALLRAPGIARMVFMVQEEAADRLAAAAGTAAYGAVSVLLQCRCRVEVLRRIAPSVFYPQPAVDSSVVRLTPGAPDVEPPPDFAAFATFVRRGFAAKRKQLAKLLGGSAQRHVWQGVLAELGVRPDARAQDLSPAAWAALGRKAAEIAKNVEKIP